ncbi:MAG: hypothetical protein GAK39_02380 [Variovorax sp.]|nr:MAG: hypothetical protein GAK39_02380 [Variovorax sp.]
MHRQARAIPHTGFRAGVRYAESGACRTRSMGRTLPICFYAAATTAFADNASQPLSCHGAITTLALHRPTAPWHPDGVLINGRRRFAIGFAVVCWGAIGPDHLRTSSGPAAGLLFTAIGTCIGVARDDHRLTERAQPAWQGSLSSPGTAVFIDSLRSSTKVWPCGGVSPFVNERSTRLLLPRLSVADLSRLLGAPQQAVLSLGTCSIARLSTMRALLSAALVPVLTTVGTAVWMNESITPAALLALAGRSRHRVGQRHSSETGR